MADPGWVYFAQAPDGRIKIGITGDVDRRMLSLRREAGGPLVLRAVLMGHGGLEAFCHRWFAATRIPFHHGRGAGSEWFHPSRELNEFIEVARGERALSDWCVSGGTRFNAWHYLRGRRHDDVADSAGVDRRYWFWWMCGDQPSLSDALKIETATDGEVPIETFGYESGIQLAFAVGF
jgi:hypothetical protein